MKNILDGEDDPYLSFLREETPVSNSLLENLGYNNEFCNQMHIENEVKVEEEPEMSENSRAKKPKNKTKQKKKVFYRDRVAELMKDDNYIKQEYNYVDYTHYQKGKSPISRDEQLKRNRESAKNSRQRKKEYVGILEIKNEQNQKTIQDLTEKLRQVTIERDRLRQFNHTEIKNFMSSKNEAYEKLSKLIYSSASTEKQIEEQVKGMLQKFGASGSQRISAINYYMNEIVEILLSDIHKYFINSSALNQGFLSKQNQKLDLQIIQVLKIDNVKVTQIMQKYKDRFYKEACVFKDLTQEFYRIYKSIESQGKIIENVFKELIKQLNIRSVGQLILWFQQNKFRRDVKKVRSDWIQQLQTGQEIIQCVRKQTKLQKL